jgi:methionyl-tRNA formyltransferase
MRANKKMNNMPRFAFFGTPALACEILDELEGAGYTPSLVVTMPDRPQGRGMQVHESAVGAWARARGIETLKPEKLDEACIAALAAHDIPLAIVVAYGKIVPQAVLDSFSRGMWNIHYSLLPRFRGATPVESAILAGDTETGVAIQRMVFALDAGPIVALESTAIDASETAPALRGRLNAIAKKLLVQIFPQLVSGEVSLTEQDATQATRCGKMQKTDGDISSDDDITRWRKYRAYYAWPGTYFFAERGGRTIRVKILEAHWEREKFVIDVVTPEGKGAMPFATFLASGATLPKF